MSWRVVGERGRNRALSARLSVTLRFGVMIRAGVGIVQAVLHTLLRRRSLREAIAAGQEWWV